MVNVSTLKGGFIAVNVVRILFINDFYIFIQSTGMEDVVLIQQSDEFSRCHGKAGVSVTGNSLILFQFFINDSSIGTGCILFADFSHIAMGIIGAVRQAEFPVLVGLVHDRIQHFHLEFFLIIPKGN